MADMQGSSAVIDSIQIKIKSDASGAADGILDVAIALGELKKNGSVGVAVRNLERLADALGKFTSVNTNASKLRSVADAAAKLSSVGSFSKVINQLNRLPTALSGLNSVNTDDIGGKFERIGNAASHLSNIKAGGLSSMVNSLSKIKDVTDSLDDDTIGRFAQKVQTLSDKLTPLSQKMSTVSSGFKAINSNAKRAGDGVKQLGSRVNATTLNMSSMITVINGVVSALRPVINLLVNSISDAMEWDGISQRFGRGFGKQAEEVYTWVQRLNEELGINSQQFMQYSSTYATMLTGFGVAAEDASTMAVGYMELAYDIWAGYNDIYGSLDEAATAVRSAISGEVEPIRRAGFTIIESTLEQTAANYGLSGSLETMTESQKSYLRYLTLVDQAYSQNLVGTYAKEMTTAEGLMRTFRQQLKSLAQTFGSVFLPALVKVMPWVNAFVELLGEAIRAVATFFDVEIQEVKWGGFTDPGVSGSLGEIAGSAGEVADSMGDAADSVDKVTESINDLKRATIGIDELNVISPPTKAGGAGGAGWGNTGVGGIDGLGGGILGDLGVDSLWDESIFDSVSNKVDELKEKILEFFDKWKTEIAIVGGALAALGMSKMLTHLGEALMLGNGFLGVMKTISKLATTAIIVTIMYSLMTELFDSYIDGEQFRDYVKALFVGALGTAVLYSMWGTTGLVIGLAVIAAASLSAVIDNGGITNVESAIVAVTGLASGIGAISLAVKKLAPILANSNLGAFIALLKEGHGFLPTLAATFPKLASAFSGIGTAVSGAVTALAGFLGLPVAATVGIIIAVLAALASAVYFVKENWDEVKAAVVEFFEENIAPKLESIKECWDKLKDALAPLAPLFNKIKDALAPVIEKIKDFFANLDWSVVGEVFEWIGGIVVGVVGGPIAGAFNALVGMIENFIQTFTGIVEIVVGVVELIVAVFSGGDIKAAWDRIWTGIVDTVKGIWGLLSQPFVDFYEGVIGWFKKMWDILVGHSIVPDTIDAIVDCFLSLPGRIFGSVSNFVTGIIDRFKNLGSGLTSKVGAAWDTVKNWWAKKSDLSTYTPAIGNIKEKLSSAWSTAKTWWSKSKGKLSEYTPSIGNIKSKLSSAWSTAKNWWNRSKGSMSYTPTIGSIKSKLQSAWSTAKSWWNRNVKLSIPSLSFKVTYSSPSGTIKKAIVKALGLSGWPKLSFAANGGMFDAGSLIWAGEAGAEIVANAGGGKTGVMNVDQMQEAVYEGVYAAMMAAMRGRGDDNGGQAVNIYLDGKQLTSVVEKRQHERGASILGAQVRSY